MILIQDASQALIATVFTGESLDEMRLLEEQARKIAEDVKQDNPKQKTLAFVK